MAGVASPHGKNFLELDLHGKTTIDGIYQKIKTEANRQYEITFMVRSRNPKGGDDEAVVLEWNDVKPKAYNHGFKSDKFGEWAMAKAIVTGTGGMDKLTLRESVTKGASDGTGPFLDAVSMVALPTYSDYASDNCGVLANMVENCSFERTYVPDNSFLWVAAEQVPGWQSLSGTPVELWGKDFLNVAAPDGNVIMELDSHANSATDGVYQLIETKKDQRYTLTFSIRARGSNPDTDDEAVVCEWNGVKLEHHGFRAAAKGTWTTVTTTVKGTGGKDKLTFRETTTNKGDDSTG